MKNLKITKRNLNELKPSPYNPRKIDETTLLKLKKSIEEFGYVEPIIVNTITGNIVGGNQRLKALQMLGAKEAEVIKIELDEKKEKLLNLALNKIQGDWNQDKLGEILEELQEDQDLYLSGFDSEEIENILDSDWLEDAERELEEIDFEDAIEVPAWIVIRGPDDEIRKIYQSLFSENKDSKVRIEKSCD